MLNTARLNELADIIERAPHSRWTPGPKDPSSATPITFNMAVWSCDGAACIGGWAASLWAEEGAWTDSYMLHRTLKAPNLRGAANALGLGETRAEHLFYPHHSPTWCGDDYHTIMPKQAAATLRELAETGDVDWHGVRPEGQRPASSTIAYLRALDLLEEVERHDRRRMMLQMMTLPMLRPMRPWRPTRTTTTAFHSIPFEFQSSLLEDA
jgi:hypothetical protein